MVELVETLVGAAMSDPFVHLRVASGYSLRYGASQPAALVAAATDAEMDTLAITDRDGLYGAVKFARACQRAGIAPVVGVDHTMADGSRAVSLATSRRGWASLCRLSSAVHLAGDRGRPRCAPELLAGRDDLVVMLGDDSDLGRTLATGSPDEAERVLRRWLELVDRHRLAIAVTNHHAPGQGAGSAALAGRMLGFADAHGITGVLTNAVRMAGKHLAPTVDVLDASRRLVPLNARAVDRRNAEGYLKTGKEMLAAADEVARLAGRRDADQLIGDTRMLAIRARLDPHADIGLGEIHLPEFDVLDVRGTAPDAMTALTLRCEAGIAARYGTSGPAIEVRLADELAVIEALGFASYFLTVAEVVAMIARLGVRCAARGSGAGSLVNYLLGISGVDPMRYGLLMERFLSPLRQVLPDIDIDVESARRTEIYDAILDVFGGERVACVAMPETYRVRHAIRDVGAALSLPPSEIDAIAKAFPHIRAGDATAALRDLPELRAAGLGERRLEVLFSLVESLDGLPRHIALHPCGVLLSDTTLLDRTPVEASFGGFPMSQFDKNDVEELGLLKLDVLGIRMQSAMAHAIGEIRRVEGVEADIDGLAPYDDPDTYDLIGKAVTLGCFQIESPGQRELVGKFGPSDSSDIIIDISLFRPGPVKSEMVVPFLEARQGWRDPGCLHPDLTSALAETGGVVVFHEQVIQIIAIMTGCTLAQGDEARRALGRPDSQADVKRWFVPTALGRGYAQAVVDRVWFVLESFASFGFCKAHAAAFALPTYQSAWLKRHYPAHFLAGVLTHDPGMYPKRLILEEARRCGIAILGLDVNVSDEAYRVEKLDVSAVVELVETSESLVELVETSESLVELVETSESLVELVETPASVGGVGAGGGLDSRKPASVAGSLGGQTHPHLESSPPPAPPVLLVGVAGSSGSTASAEPLVELVETPSVALVETLSVATGSAAEPLVELVETPSAMSVENGFRPAQPASSAGFRPAQPASSDGRRPADLPVRGKRLAPGDGLPDGRGCGIRLSLADVKGITDAEIARIVAGRPYHSLSDFWQRTGNPSDITERLALAGAFDALYGIEPPGAVCRRGAITRRDLLLAVADLERADRAHARAHGRARGLKTVRAAETAGDPREQARRQAKATKPVAPQEIQLPLDFSEPDPDQPVEGLDGLDQRGQGLDGLDQRGLGRRPVPSDVVPTGLAELSEAERLGAELEIVGLDASRHLLAGYLPFLDAIEVIFAADLLSRRSHGEVLIAGVKVATQTPPVRSGRRVVFLTVDDSTGPADATFFEDAQGPYAATVFNSWLLLVRGELRRTGPRGVSVRATGAWDLTVLHNLYTQALTETGEADRALQRVRELMAEVPNGYGVGDATGRRRVLVHASGFRQSPYADVKPAGESIAAAPRKLWHSSPGSSGR
ncbi:DNA polymerase III subunit alpha [Micropruina sp.]|uniref:DNA polymerase III subunit alpha n=1 Tax=Micropruina sp. TaxID=2737536 RepID=UPI0039E6B4A0